VLNKRRRDRHELKELLKSIRNRCEIAEFLIDSGVSSVDKWLPTILEDMYVDCQTVIDEYCVEGDNEQRS